jgi:hypothetical protein
LVGSFSAKLLVSSARRSVSITRFLGRHAVHRRPALAASPLSDGCGGRKCYVFETLSKLPRKPSFNSITTTNA